MYAKNYPMQAMSMETFYRICAHISPEIFPKCGLIGWGEPFLDPGYFEKLRHLKRKGYIVGSTTSLAGPIGQIALKVIDGGLDHLNISADSMHFNASGIPLPRIVEKIDMLFKIREMRASTLHVGIVIVAFKTAYDTIRETLRAVKDYPFLSIGIVPLMMMPSKHLYCELPTKKEFEFLKVRLKEEFPFLPLSFDFTLREGNLSSPCRSGISRSMYVSYRGDVSPCAITAMEFPSVTFSGDEAWTQPLSFGRLDQSDFTDIWDSENYRCFRSRFKENNVPHECVPCNQWRELP